MISSPFFPAREIAVIGGGIVGLSIALKLQLAGEKVTVFDKAGAGKGCSKGNAGHFATEQIFPLATPALLPQLPKMLLSPLSPVSIRFQDIPNTVGWMLRFLSKARKTPTKHATSALTALNGAALSSWYHLLEQAELPPLISPKGSLLVFESEALFASYKPTLASLTKGGVKHEVWDAATVREHIPDIADAVKFGVFFPDTAHTAEPYELCLSMKKSFLEHGGQWVEDKIHTINQTDNRISLNDNPQSFDKVVVAMGVESTELVKKVSGVTVPLQAERGYHLMMPDLADTLPFPVSSADRKFIMTPMRYGLRLAGTVEYAATNAPPNMKRAAMLKRLAQGVLRPEVNLDNTGEQWMGNRPSLPDSLPVIDHSPDEKILYAFGHQHLGLTQAAITADLIADLHFKHPPRIDLTPFRLQRFS